jgi:hypothetical protein
MALFGARFGQPSRLGVASIYLRPILVDLFRNPSLDSNPSGDNQPWTSLTTFTTSEALPRNTQKKLTKPTYSTKMADPVERVSFGSTAKVLMHLISTA